MFKLNTSHDYILNCIIMIDNGMLMKYDIYIDCTTICFYKQNVSTIGFFFKAELFNSIS